MADSQKPRILVSGVTGKVGMPIAAYIDKDPRVELYGVGITESGNPAETVKVNDTLINLIRANEIGQHLEELKGADIVVEYIATDHRTDNLEWYNKLGLPVVSGTTGAGKEAFIKSIEDAGNLAVVVANAAPPIITFQNFFVDLAGRNEGVLTGYAFALEESHQQSKGRETSGTAKEVVKAVNVLGMPFENSDIDSYRTEAAYEMLGIPKEFWGGHGWHTYRFIAPGKRHTDAGEAIFEQFRQYLATAPTLKGYSIDSFVDGEVAHLVRLSPDKTVKFSITISPDTCEIQHNVNGRSIYAPFNVDAALYLLDREAKGAKGEVSSGMDVLEERGLI